MTDTSAGSLVQGLPAGSALQPPSLPLSLQTLRGPFLLPTLLFWFHPIPHCEFGL